MGQYSNSLKEINEAIFVFCGVDSESKGYRPTADNRKRLQEMYPKKWESLHVDIHSVLEQVDRPIVEWFVPVPLSSSNAKKIDDKIAEIHPWLSVNARSCICSYFTYCYR